MSVKTKLKESFIEVLQEIEPCTLVQNKCAFTNDALIINNTTINLPKNKKIHLFGSGKAVLSMAKAVYEHYENKITKAVLIGPYENTLDKKNLTYHKSSHPIPTQKSVEAAKSLKNTLNSLSKDDFFIYVLSGGTSSLIEWPVKEISLHEFQETTNIMIKGSMPIVAMNCVRKHLSQVKGGRLISSCNASGIVLVLSDVLSNDLEAIGSAPLYYDSSSFKQAIVYLKEYELFNKIPQRVQDYLYNASNKHTEETPKKAKENIQHFLIASNEVLLQKIQDKLLIKGIVSTIVPKKIEEDVNEVVKHILQFIKNKQEGCFIFGAEALVEVTSHGKGGRNQHLALSFLEQFPKDKNITFLSAASDGIDGNSLSAGAIVNNASLTKAKQLNLDIKSHLNSFNSNVFFKKMDDLITTGPSHNNILDVIIIHIENKK